MLEVIEVPEDKIDQTYSAIEIHSIEVAALTRKLRDLGKLPDRTLENKIVKLKHFDSFGPDEQRAVADFEKRVRHGKPQ